MYRRHASAAIILGSAVVFLATACGPSDSATSGAAGGSAASGAADSAASSAPSSQTGTPNDPAGAGDSATRTPGAPTVAPTQAGTATKAPTGAPTVAPGSADGDRKPCHLPAGYDGFFKLDSAEVYQGDTTVRVTPETCTVNRNNDEDVIYTPIEAARSFVVASDASVNVFSGTGNPDSVAPHWLVNHKLVNSPYFYYHVSGQNQITAMQEIYHP
jgi:hypothetical protein